MQVTIKGIRAYYSDTGKGQVIIAVHGWMHDRHSFDQLTKVLKQKYRIIALDLPNFGEADTSVTVASLKSYAEFLKSFVYSLAIPEYALMGHSMGGQLIAYATAHGYVKPTKLILLAPSGVRSLRPLNRKIRQAIAPPIGYIVPKKLREPFFKVMETDFSPDLSKEHKKVIKKVLKKDIQKDVRRISTPTLLVFGSDDIFTTVAMGEVLQKNIPDSRLEVVEGHRHRLQQTASRQVATLIQGFMS